MSRPLRIAIAFVVALVISVGTEVLLVDRGPDESTLSRPGVIAGVPIDETIYGDGLIGVWALLGIATVVVLAYFVSFAGRYVLQREDDPYGDGDHLG